MRSLLPANKGGGTRRLGGPPPRIGFIVDWLEDAYQSEVLAGAEEVARERGATLVVLPGGVPDGPHLNGQRRNELYRLITEDSYEALVLMSGTLTNVSAEELLEKVCPGFPAARICSVAVDVPGCAAVLVNNERGMRQAMEHLVQVHGARTIAFIRGPRSNAEAETRYQVYQTVLEENGIAFDERLVVEGDFRGESGTRAIEELFDERKLSIQEVDALVSADDVMAMTAMDELRRRGVEVPTDLAVMGFDDVQEARLCHPPLSSVRQPLRDQGREAVRLALASVQSRGEVEQKTLDTVPQWRRSCGCVRQQEQAIATRSSQEGRLGLEAGLIRRRELVLAELTRAARGAFVAAGRGWEVTLFNGLQDEFRGQAGSFYEAYERVLQKVLAAGADVAKGNALISALRNHLLLCAGADPAARATVEDLLHDARIVTADLVERSFAQKRIEVERWARVVSNVSTCLVTTFELSGLSRVLQEQLPRIGVRSCYVARYQQSLSGQAELLAAFGPWGRLGDGYERQSFPVRELVPRALVPREERMSVVVEPLLNGDEHVGIAVIELSGVQGYVYEALRELLSMTLRGAVLLGEFAPSTRDPLQVPEVPSPEKLLKS